MLVFNLKEYPVEYKGRMIPADGGSLDYPELTFIPDRDRELESKGVLAFGGLPQWWRNAKVMKERELRLAAEAAGKPQVVVNVEPTAEAMKLTVKGDPEEIPIRSKKK